MAQTYDVSPEHALRSVVPYKNSWIELSAIKRDLLYISDEGTNDVHIYSWPQGKRVGELTGLDYPEGECTDNAGNVWITELGSSKIVEYWDGPDFMDTQLVYNVDLRSVRD